MNEATLGDTLQKLREKFQEVENQQAIDFIEENHDPIVIQLNTAEAEMEGLTRQKKSLQRIDTMLEELSYNYLLFRRQEITKAEYQDQDTKIKYEWKNYIGDQLMYGVISDSGTALQFVQQIRSLGLLENNPSSRMIDASLLEKNTTLIERFRTLLEFLKGIGISAENLDPSTIETTDWNALLHSLVILYESTVRARSILRKAHNQNNTPPTQDKKLIETIHKQLGDNLQVFFRLYSQQQCSFPSGLSLVTMRLKIHKQAEAAKKEADTFAFQYEDLTSEAYALGYQRDASTNLYHKVSEN